MIPIWLMRGRLGNEMFQLAYLYAQQQRGLIPNIWLQDPKWFAGAEDQVRSAFSEGIRPLPFVSIHVRRGDYIRQKAVFVNLFDTDYYERAIACFPGETFRVFSDDIAWCKKKWGYDPRFTFNEGQDEIWDMNQMAGCRHNIIANSSFRWWAGWLNPNPNKRVIYPKQWFVEGVVATPVGFPEGWTAL